MKFKLPRQIINKNLKQIVSREIKKQKLEVIKVNKKNLKEISDVSKIIRKKGLPPYLICKKLPRKLGKGIFLHPKAKPILKGQIIAPYAGNISLLPQKSDNEDGSYAFIPVEGICLTKEEQALFDRGAKFHAKRQYHFKVDASKNGNFTRFINHSDKPNVVAHLFKVPSNDLGISDMPAEIIYIAKKTIRPGEQLLICYEDEEKSYWGVSKIKPFSMNPKTFTIDL
jgi:hypothetical protein